MKSGVIGWYPIPKKNNSKAIELIKDTVVINKSFVGVFRFILLRRITFRFLMTNDKNHDAYTQCIMSHVIPALAINAVCDVAYAWYL